MNKIKKYSKQIITISVVCLFIAYVWFLSPKAMQNDTFWSIKVGERIVKEGVFGLDNFSIHKDLYYIAHHFLTDVLIYVIHSFAGFAGLYVVQVIFAIIIAGLLYLLNKEICGNEVISGIVLAVQIFLLSMFFTVRAQMVSYILFIAEILLLEKYKKESKLRYIIGLSIIPIILANFHMGVVPFYFIILGVYIISLIKIKLPFLEWTKQTDKVRLKQLLIVAIIGIITIFINPYFIDGVVYPFKTIGNDFINSTISEFQAFTIGFDGGYTLMYIAIVIFALILSKKKMATGDFLLLFGTLFMSLTAIRYVGLFVICSVVVLRYIDGIKAEINLRNEDKKAAIATFVIVMAIITARMGYEYFTKRNIDYIPLEQYPVKAVEFLKSEIAEEDRIFNYYDWGSYLMLNDIKVYIDSRCDLYTKEYNKQEIADDHNKLLNGDKDYKEIIDKYDINLFIIPIDNALETLLNENEDYNMLYKDDLAVIFKKQ